LKNQNQSQVISSSSTTENSHTNGTINHGFSTDTLYHQLAIIDSVPSTGTISLNQQGRVRENWRNAISIIRQLMKNTRYIFVVVVNLSEGVLLKCKFNL
jgi:hypothetical protein